MSSLRALLIRLRERFIRDRLETRLDEEIQCHVEMLADDYVRSGLPREEALRRARLALGGIDPTKEAVRDEWSTWLDSLWHDIRFAGRTFGRDWKFTVATVLTLALCVGATTGIFSVVNSVLFRPLPYPDPERLTVVLSTAPGVDHGFYSAPGVFVDWRERTTSFENLSGLRRTTALWTGASQSQELPVGRASSSFFALLGLSPVLGRAFTDQEEKSGQDVALLDASFWQREFGAGTGVLNRTIVLDDTSYTIVGVLPAGVCLPKYGAVDVWLPLAAQRGHRGGGDILVAGRLRPEVTLQSAQAEMNALTLGIGKEHQEDSRHGALLMPMREWMIGEVQPPFLAVLGAVVFLLLIGCTNVGSLLAARTTARRRELAIRASLGAGRLRLVRQMLVECLLLGLAGGALGLGLALAIVHMAQRISAITIPRLEEIRIDAWLFIAAAAISVGCAVLFSVAPALGIGRLELRVDASKGQQWPGKMGGNRMRSALVAAEIALALVLLSGAGLMANTFLRLLSIDLGFHRNALVTVNASLPFNQYAEEKSLDFYRRLAEILKPLPGVRAISVSDWPPLVPVHFPYRLTGSNGSGRTECEAEARHVDAGYLRATGIPLLAGREFERTDDTRRPRPVMLNKTAARLLFGEANPIGRQLASNYADRHVMEVVGLVGEARQLGLTETPGAQIYVPLAYRFANYVVIRTDNESCDLTNDIRAAVQRLDPHLPLPTVSTADTLFDQEVAAPRFYLRLLGALGLAGLLLASIGVYGVLAYTVEQRTHEFGVRMAIGATGSQIVRLLLGFGLQLTLVGVCLGLLGAVALTRILTSLLYEVRPNDPLTLGAATIGLVSIVFLTCWMAAWRATRIDPLKCLRWE